MYPHGYDNPSAMYPHGYDNPRPLEQPYRPHENQHGMMQEHQDLYQHPHHPAQHYPPAYSSPSFPHPSSFHYPPAPGSSPFDAAPRPDYLQHSFPPPPPSHQSLYPPPPDPYPSQYGLPHTPSFEAHHHIAPAYDAYVRPTFGERILSSLEYAFARPTNGEHSQPPSENLSHSPSIPHHTSSFQEGKPQILERSSVALLDSTNTTPPPSDVELPKGQLVRVFCKSSRSYNLAVKGGRLTMVEADSENKSQQWVRDDKYSIRVRDKSGHPAFMLINKASKMVLKHASSKWQEVQLTYYSPDIQDDDLFWTESQDFGEGFKTLRMASDTTLNLTVGHGNKIEDGSPIILDTWHKKDTQLWKIFPL